MGDIVVFQHGRKRCRVAHRVVERRDGGYRTKGDRNLRMDSKLLTERNHAGRVHGIFFTNRAGKKPLPESLRKSGPALAAPR